MAKDCVQNEFIKRKVKKIVMLGGGNDAVNMDHSENDVAGFLLKFEETTKMYLDKGFEIVCVQCLGRKKHKEVMKELNKGYRKTCKKLNIPFNSTKSFSVKHLAKDGVHPKPDKINELMKEIYNAQRSLG